MKSLAGSPNGKAFPSSRLGSERRSAPDCSQVVRLASQLTVLVMKYPSSPEVLVMSGQITGVSSITCSDQEKGSLTVLEKPFEEAIAYLDDALESVQQQLIILTGSTASTENILESNTTKM